MSIHLSRLALAATAAAALAACHTIPSRPGAAAAAHSGLVSDNLGRTVAGAQVTIGGVSARTGRDGRFRIAASGRGPFAMAVAHPDFAYYSRILSGPVMDGQFRLTRASRIAADPTRPISVRDTRRPEDCVADPAVPGSGPPCGPGFAIDIPANTLVDAAGNRPAGMVEVRIGTFEVHTESMPGPFVIAASDSDPTDIAYMIPYGAGTVDVRDTATGRELNLAPGSRARIEIPVHRVAQQRTGADAPPAIIPLLRFNRTIQRWVQIGTMPLTGDRYAAEVDHLTDFNADVGATNWGCIYIQFWGNVPSQLYVGSPKAVQIQLTPHATSPSGGSPPSGPPISFPTLEKGFNIIVTGHTVYTLPANRWYWGRAFNGGTQLTDDSALPSPWVYVIPQNPQHPTLPVNPAGTCTHMDLYWDPNAMKVGNWSWRDLDLLAGTITYATPTGIIEAADRPRVIDRIGRNEAVWPLGIVRGQPWILVRTARGRIGLAPVAGADLSQTRRPEPAPPGPQGDRPPAGR